LIGTRCKLIFRFRRDLLVGESKAVGQMSERTAAENDEIRLHARSTQGITDADTPDNPTGTRNPGCEVDYRRQRLSAIVEKREQTLPIT
jgi:hypothetical protein